MRAVARMTSREILGQYFEAVIKDLRGDQSAKGMVASGNSADSLTYGTDSTGGQLTGSDYFFWQIVGRRPGKFAPPDAILQWIRDKGITPNDPKTSLKSLAFLINRKMATSGTDIFMGKKKGLEFQEAIGGANMEKLTSQIGKAKIKEITTFLVTGLKETS